MKAIVLFISLLLPTIGFAQQFSIDWFTIDGGGGTSTGSAYSVSGTLGQPDAGEAMSGGNLSVNGGFWSWIAVVQTVGAPALTITPSGASVKVSWPSLSTGFVLQQNSDLTTTNWPASGFSISDDGTNKSITVTSPTGNLFFRLMHP